MSDLIDRQATQKYIIEKIRQSVQLMDDTQDSISRKKAVDAINKYDFEFPEYMERFVTELRDAMKEDLKHDIEELPSAQQWIPVSERPPEDLKPVNITYINEDPAPYYEHIKGIPFTATAIYYRGGWYWWSCTCVDVLAEYGHSYSDSMDEGIEVKAWMPLPRPWKGEE